MVQGDQGGLRATSRCFVLLLVAMSFIQMLASTRTGAQKRAHSVPTEPRSLVERSEPYPQSRSAQPVRTACASLLDVETVRDAMR